MWKAIKTSENFREKLIFPLEETDEFVSRKIMVRFNKKESEARKELLASLNQVNEAKENENGKDDKFSALVIQFN